MRKSWNSAITVLGLLAFLAVFPILAFCEDSAEILEEPVVVRTMEKVNGDISGISSRYINLLYEQRDDQEFEMYLPLDEKVELSQYKTLSDVQVGDRVELTYEKMVTAPDTPEERVTMMVKKVRFIKRPKDNTALSSEGA
jgi:hypothetical protein